MIELLTGPPDNVVGARAVGEVEDDDYDDVLVPAIDEALGRHDRIRLRYVLGDEFEGYEADAVWSDAELGVRHLTSFERIAVVTDTTWARRSVKLLGWMIPGSARTFGLAELDEARVWVGEA